MPPHALTPEQEAVAHNIDTAGLAMLGAGVLGGVMHNHGVPGGLMSRVGSKLHDVGPYLDLAGLALIAPPVMNRLAKRISPDKPKPEEAPVAEPEALQAGEIPVAYAPTTEEELAYAKTASYALGAWSARRAIRPAR